MNNEKKYVGRISNILLNPKKELNKKQDKMKEVNDVQQMWGNLQPEVGYEDDLIGYGYTLNDETNEVIITDIVLYNIFEDNYNLQLYPSYKLANHMYDADYDSPEDNPKKLYKTVWNVDSTHTYEYNGSDKISRITFHKGIKIDDNIHIIPSFMNLENLERIDGFEIFSSMNNITDDNGMHDFKLRDLPKLEYINLDPLKNYCRSNRNSTPIIENVGLTEIDLSMIDMHKFTGSTYDFTINFVVNCGNLETVRFPKLFINNDWINPDHSNIGISFLQDCPNLEGTLKIETCDDQQPLTCESFRIKIADTGLTVIDLSDIKIPVSGRYDVYLTHETSASTGNPNLKNIIWPNVDELCGGDNYGKIVIKPSMYNSSINCPTMEILDLTPVSWGLTRNEDICLLTNGMTSLSEIILSKSKYDTDPGVSYGDFMNEYYNYFVEDIKGTAGHDVKITIVD